MLSVAAGVSPRGLDTYGMSATLVNQPMSLPIIKSESNDTDSKVHLHFSVDRTIEILSFSSVNVAVHRKPNPPMEQRQQLRTPNISMSILPLLRH